MPKLSKFTEHTLSVVANVQGENITMTVRPYAWTVEQEAALMEAANASAAEAKKRTLELFLEVVVSWDITDDDGNKYPLTQEALSNFPTVLLGNLMEEVRKGITFRR